MIITINYIFILFISLILTTVIWALDSNYFTSKYAAKKLHGWRNSLLVLLVILIVYLCILNFPVTLTLLVFVTGIIALFDWLLFARKRKAEHRKHGVIVENARGFFPVLLLVWVIRSFIIQPYHVPSGSLEPTVLAGDFIVANQFDYGLRFPIDNIKFINIGEPKVGDIVLFYNPTDPSVVFIKRVAGTPRDHVQYKNKILYINGKEAKQTPVGMAEDLEPGREPLFVNRMIEDLNGIRHEIFVWPTGGETQDFDFVVPPGQYFMMGDNRDNSDDSRYGFGSGQLIFVPERNIIGKAFGIWMSWDANNWRIRWNRIGKGIH